ncbi:signal peptidase II [Arcanobacterium ihumii]|uniref:signal peptidase II n=1 Tax=Arcanobacterium ihumii TaxID=2138162 RepID=UPI00190F41EA|nr:signal peptidase II [Arcanobacterium ihumii]
MKKRSDFWIIPLSILLVIVACDQLTKLWAESQLSQGREIEVIGKWLSLKLTYNSGAAFSLGNGSTWVFTIFAIFVAIAMPFILKKYPRTPQRIILSTIWAGAVGNLIDRLIREPGIGRGHVVDFINYNGWFIGNVADIALVLGVIAFIVIEAIDPTLPPEEATQEPNETTQVEN